MLMRFLLLSALLVSGSVAAFAGEPLRPVEAVMGVTIRSSGAETPDSPDTSTSYFDPDSLMALYSVGFTRDLAAAVVFMKGNDEQMFLGSEPVIGGQDNCPVKDVTYEVGAEKNGTVPVTVQFQAFYCFGEEGAKVRSKVVFDVVKEGVGDPEPWYYIDDIRHIGDDGKTANSLREQLRILAKD